MTFRGRSRAAEVPDQGARQSDVGGDSRLGDEHRRRSLHGRFGGAEPRLEALADAEAGGIEGPEVVAMEVTVPSHDAGPSARILEVGAAAEGDRRRVKVG